MKPACPARVKAQWRQVDREHDEAVKVRRQWMTLIGCDDSEIEQAILDSFELSLADELEQLVAANEMLSRTRMF